VRLRPNLNLDLSLDLALNLNLCLNLNLFLFRKPFEKPFSSSFRSLQSFMHRSSLVLPNLVPCRRTSPQGQSLGRPLTGEIVVLAAPDHYT
jgi:hypothetical protein